MMTGRQISKAILFVLLCAFVAACNKTPSAEVSSGAHSVTLKWTRSTSNIAGYRIYRSADANTSPGLLAVTPPKDTQYVDKSVEAGRTYYYSVKSFDSAGHESVAATISATIPPD